MIETPLLSEPLEGSVYLATQSANLFGAPMALYLQAQGSGALIKLVAQLTPNPVTGQLTLTFEDMPQLPFNEIQLRFSGGRQALLVNPLTCGKATTTSTLEPWSAGPSVTPFSWFEVVADRDALTCTITATNIAGQGSATSPGVMIPSDSSSSSGTTNSGTTNNAGSFELPAIGSLSLTQNKIHLRLHCLGPSECKGTAMLTAPATHAVSAKRSNHRTMDSQSLVLGSAHFSIAARASEVVTIRLKAVGQRTVHKAHHGLRVRLAITTTAAGHVLQEEKTIRLKIVSDVTHR